MKKIRLAHLGFLPILLAGLCAVGSEEHSFFAAGWNSGGPALYDALFNMTWQAETKDEISDGWVLPDGGIVYSFSKRKEGLAGVVRLDAEKKSSGNTALLKGMTIIRASPCPTAAFFWVNAARRPYGWWKSINTAKN
jgi:hypothetical protein